MVTILCLKSSLLSWDASREYQLQSICVPYRTWHIWTFVYYFYLVLQIVSRLLFSLTCFIWFINHKQVFSFWYCLLWHMGYWCRFLLPATLIVINDIAAYIFGFFFGKTPLIKLSPKKTWEGFIGASVTTIISAFVVSIGFFLGHGNHACFIMFIFLAD